MGLMEERKKHYYMKHNTAKVRYLSTLLVLFGAGWVGIVGVLLVLCGPPCGRVCC